MKLPNVPGALNSRLQRAVYRDRDSSGSSYREMKRNKWLALVRDKRKFQEGTERQS